MNIFLKELEKQNNITVTQNGAKTFKGTLDSNLDLFSKDLRSLDHGEALRLFILALDENSELAVKNLLHLLDIREGKGERAVSKRFINHLLTCESIKVEHKERVLELIPELGRWDYLIDLYEGGNSQFDTKILKIIDNAIEENNLLVYKWMPSTRGARKHVAKKLCEHFGGEVAYRKMLSAKRAELKLIETLLTEKRYDEIDFSKIPSKAMLKYRAAFMREVEDELDTFLTKVNNGEAKINAKNLQAHEIVSKFGRFPLGSSVDVPKDERLLNTMWNNQTNFVDGDHSAIVVADTSGSMSGTPLHVSLGLALYFAERNKGEWADAFITFSSEANFVKLPKGNIQDKLRVIKEIVENTNINSVFKLILETALSSEEAKESMPEHIVIVSDMEFDDGTRGFTNFEEWENNFSANGLELPKIIFWNASNYGIQSTPVVKETKNVALVSGYSPAVFKNLFSLENLSPETLMLQTLSKYDELLK